MIIMKPSEIRTANYLEVIFILCGLMFTVTLAHYFQFQDMGFYEDDYSLLLRNIGVPLSLQSVFQELQHHFISWPMGRPGRVFTILLGWIGYSIDGHNGIRIIGFVIVLLNTIFCFFIFRKVGSNLFSFIGSLAFALFPAMTVHSYLNNVLLAQLSLLFTLTAMLFYLSGRKISYILFAVLSLVTYESPVFLLLVIPLFTGAWDKKKLVETVLNASSICSLVILKFGMSYLMKDPRVTGSAPYYVKKSIASYVPEIMGSFVIGPATGLRSFFEGFLYALTHIDWNITMVMLVAFSMYTVLFFRYLDCEPGSFQSKKYIKILIIALLLSSLGYIISSFLRYPPTVTLGRMSRIHLAGTLGGAMFIGFLLTSVIEMCRNRKIRITILLVCSLYFSGLVGYRYLIQNDFVKSWQGQRALWRQVVALCPDMEPGTIIFVPYSSMPEKTRFILTHSWSERLIPWFLYDYSDTDEKPLPRFFRVENKWREKTKIVDGNVMWFMPPALWSAKWIALPQGNLIILKKKNGRLRRLQGTIEINGISFPLKYLPGDEKKSSLPKGKYYKFLIEDR